MDISEKNTATTAVISMSLVWIFRINPLTAGISCGDYTRPEKRQMTVSSTQSYVQYNADGVTRTFTIPFYFLLNSDISAMVADASGNISEPVNDNDFTVTGAGDSGGGSLTFNTAYATGNTILIYRDPPATQETKYYENGKFPAASHEAALDKLTMLIQEFGWRFDSLTLKKPSIFASYYDAINNRISNVAEPTESSDAVTKSYADAIGSGSKSYTDSQVAAEAAQRLAADNLERDARAEADAKIQEQLTGNVPLSASAFSVISWHDQLIENSITIPDNKNAWSIGPQMAIAPGQVVTVGENSSYTVADGREVESEDLHNLIADTIRTPDGAIVVDVNDIAKDTDLSSLTGRVETAEESIETLQDGLSAAEDEISGKAASGANTDITSLKGVTDGSDAGAGAVGEFLTAASTSSVSLTTSAASNIVSLALTAGDWDVWGMVSFSTTGSLTQITAGINTTSATFDSYPYTSLLQTTFTSAAAQRLAAPIRRISTSTSKTIYLVGRTTFASGTATADGTIFARRVR